MKKKKSINCLSKKFIIKGVATTLVVLLPFSIIKPYDEPKAIVGVDDAILIATLGTLAVGGTLACYGIAKTGVIQKTASAIGEGLQDIGNGFKTVYNDLAFAKGMYDMLPKILQIYQSDVEGQNYSDNVIPSDFYYFPSTPCTYNVDWIGTHDFNLIGGCYANSVPSGVVTIDVNSNRVTIYQNGLGLSSSGVAFCDFPLKLDTTNVKSVSVSSIAPSLSDVVNPPTSISIDKEKAETIAVDYAEKHPNDNNGDKKVNYADLIPFVLDMLSKDLGDGTITPQNLSNNGMVSYFYKDGQTQGMYPYNFSEQGDKNINVEQNVTINNGSEVTEEEKNGILNILDNGVRKTTTLLNNLKSSMTNLGNTLQGLFDLLPEPISYLFYSALCLSLIFFILSLRR